MAPIALSSRSPASLLPQSHSTPTRTLSSTILNWLHKRQSSIIPTTYGSIHSGPSPGTVVGIVLGSVGGFLLLLWLLYTCLNFGTITSSSSDYTTTEEVVVQRDRRKSTHGSTRTRSRRASETVEVRRERSPVRIVREPVVERVIVEETRETREKRRPPPPRDRSESGGSDEVVVIEEHSPPRRKKSVRDREEREVRRESGYRVVDPLAYGGTIGGRKDSRRGER